ncbi:hypothetical protein EMIT0P44_280059 [Pseudomonas sp. IT-P44]
MKDHLHRPTPTKGNVTLLKNMPLEENDMYMQHLLKRCLSVTAASHNSTDSPHSFRHKLSPAFKNQNNANW